MIDYTNGADQWKEIAVKNYLDCIKRAEKGSPEYRQLKKGMEILLKYHNL